MAETQTRPRLFLSYGRRDAAELANRLRNDLVNAGYTVWQDSQEIRSGREWEDQIVDGLRSTQVVIAVLTPHAVRRATDPNNPDGTDSVCLDELYFARRVLKKPIVPLLGEPCIEIPFVVCALDYVEMLRWKDSEETYQRGLKRLLESITARLNLAPNQESPPLNPSLWYHNLRVLDFAAQLHEKRRDFVGRQWLFDEIDAWRTASSSERALLVIGDPGIGKSAFVAEMIHRNPGGQVLAYHICRADDPETLRPSTFVMSLAGMIAGRLPAFADLLEAPQYQELFDPKTVSGRPAHVLDQGLIAALHQLPAPPDGIRYLLIDALDEALTLGEGQLNIVKLLSDRVERFPAWLRIVATTRREPDVLNRLSSLRAASIDAHRQDNLDDIDRFIEARLQTPNLAERLAASRVPLATVQRKLRDKADGNFLYVATMLGSIEKDHNSFTKLDDLPHGLNGMYLQWFERKFPNPKVDFVDARKVLEVILAAREPLPEMLLAPLTDDVDLYALNDAVIQLAPFITNESATYGFYHKSLFDWLLAHKANRAFSVSVSIGNKKFSELFLREIHRCSSKVPAVKYWCSHGLEHLVASQLLLLSSPDVSRFIDSTESNVNLESTTTYSIPPITFEAFIRANRNDGIAHWPTVETPPYFMKDYLGWAISIRARAAIANLAEACRSAAVYHYISAGCLEVIGVNESGATRFNIRGAANNGHDVSEGLIISGWTGSILYSLTRSDPLRIWSKDLQEHLKSDLHLLRYMAGGFDVAGWAMTISGYFGDAGGSLYRQLFDLMKEGEQ